MIKNVIFDWSGTLIDDLVFTYRASMKVFKSIGIKKITLEKFKEEFVLPYMDFYGKFKKNPNKEIIDEVFIREINLINKSKPFPEARGVLEFLRQRKIKMVILSSYLQENLEKEIRDNNLQKYFEDINGSLHNKTEVILEIMQRNNFKPKETVYVGDMNHDIDAGKKAGVITVAASFGYNLKQALLAENPDFLIENLKELEDIVIKLS